MNKAEMIDSIAKNAKLTESKFKGSIGFNHGYCYKNIS